MGDPPVTMTPTVDEGLLGQVRSYLARRSWLVVHVPQDAMSYTVGLTSYDIPELLVVARRDDTLSRQLDQWAARSVAGELQLGPTVTVQDLELREHTFPTRAYDIASRGGLWLGRALFGQDLMAREIAVNACACLPCRAGLYLS
jgi:hypothetical protein